MRNLILPGSRDMAIDMESIMRLHIQYVRRLA